MALALEGGRILGCAYPVEPMDWPRFFGKFKPLSHFYFHNQNSALNQPINREARGDKPNLKPAC